MLFPIFFLGGNSMLGGQVRVGRDLYDVLAKFTGNDSIDESLVAFWLNDGISDFPETAFFPLRESFVDVLVDVEYDLPLNFVSVIEWLYNGVPYLKDVKITQDDKVIFSEDLTDTITLVYNIAQQPYDDLDTEIPLRKNLRMILSDFLLSAYYDQDGEGSTEESRIADKYLKRYNQRKFEALARLENRETNGPTSTVDSMPKRARYHHTTLPEEDDYDG